jgi:hypothetical protein
MSDKLAEALRKARELLEAGSDIIAYDVIEAALAAYDAAPDDEGEPESRDYIRGWNDAMKAGRDLVQIDPPPAQKGEAT